ncbi:MAG: ribosome biogenesis GTP-binding protein YihA/YsxC [Dongiaceae bacterium]
MPSESETETSAEEREAGRRLFAAECGFVAGADNPDALPPISLPEIGFAGRSNVGKSSLVNALTGRNTLARVSHTPGRTQQINFFALGDRLMLVDLPGYGYAKVSKRVARDWRGLAELYLKGRPTLRRVLLLVDSRHGLKDSDRAIMTLLDGAAQSYQIVLTKADKQKPDALRALSDAIATEAATHVAAHPEILATSAFTGLGIERLRAELALLAVPNALR